MGVKDHRLNNLRLLVCKYERHSEFRIGRVSRTAPGFALKAKCALIGMGIDTSPFRNILMKKKSNKCGYCDNMCIGKYCSIKCSSDARHRDTMDRISGELLSGCNFRCTNASILKKTLIEMKGHRCDICNNEMWMNNPIPLVMDHIDGRALNNTLSNLRLVCGNCDMQLPTYKSKNKNSDRKR